MLTYLDFEKPIAELETRVAELRETAASSEDIDIDAEVARLEAKANKLLRDTYAKLTPWQKALISRHPNRPYTLDYIEAMMTNFIEMHGDRSFADDPAIVFGMAKLGDTQVVVIGHQHTHVRRHVLTAPLLARQRDKNIGA